MKKLLITKVKLEKLVAEWEEGAKQCKYVAGPCCSDYGIGQEAGLQRCIDDAKEILVDMEVDAQKALITCVLSDFGPDWNVGIYPADWQKRKNVPRDLHVLVSKKTGTRTYEYLLKNFSSVEKFVDAIGQHLMEDEGPRYVQALYDEIGTK